ncbi:hypothetical protein GOODEAATRI_007380 [Goodea atripinnis]|uniref:Uncharacterized protein n=1 Tax=Goodea atripinnis TaxID=208336 RepID=A0ABV0PW41_9TELE
MKQQTCPQIYDKHGEKRFQRFHRLPSMFVAVGGKVSELESPTVVLFDLRFVFLTHLHGSRLVGICLQQKKQLISFS